MTQEIVIQLRITVPDGASFRVITAPEPEPRSVLDEPLPPAPNQPVNGAPVVRTIAREQPSGHSWMVGEVHAEGHKPLKAGQRGGVFCPQKLPDGSWCQFRA